MADGGEPTAAGLADGEPVAWGRGVRPRADPAGAAADPCAGAFDTVYGAWSTAGDHFVALGPNRGGYVTSFDAAGTASTRAINPPYPTGSCERAWIAPDGSFAACRPTLFTSSNAWGLDLRRPTSAPVDLGTPGSNPTTPHPFTPDGHGMLFVAFHDVLWVAINDGVPLPPISLIPPGLTLQTQPQVAMNSAGTLVAFAGQFDHPWMMPTWST
ncbi:MAG: hypothetical protein IPH80_38405 [Myxococcales bacterium]|nr:hypothetical protein [Myxococcales bacterium]